MFSMLPSGVLVVELVCGSIRALAVDAGGSVVSHAAWLLAALLPAAYWIASRVVTASWDASRD